MLSCSHLTKVGEPEDALGKMIVTPSVPLEHLNDSLKRKILDERTAEILNVLLQLWSTS